MLDTEGRGRVPLADVSAGLRRLPLGGASRGGGVHFSIDDCEILLAGSCEGGAAFAAAAEGLDAARFGAMLRKALRQHVEHRLGRAMCAFAGDSSERWILAAARALLMLADTAASPPTNPAAAIEPADAVQGFFAADRRGAVPGGKELLPEPILMQSVTQDGVPRDVALVAQYVAMFDFTTPVHSLPCAFRDFGWVARRSVSDLVCCGGGGGGGCGGGGRKNWSFASQRLVRYRRCTQARIACVCQWIERHLLSLHVCARIL